jgi:RND family efflux transporter MFP subunit
MEQPMMTTVLVALIAASSYPTPGAASGDHPHTESVTIWTDRGELFMEYQVPVAGKPARFTAHLTELGAFRAVEKAAVAIRLWKSGGAKLEGKVEGPARPGIFQPVVTLPEPGEYQGDLEVTGPDLTETFALESVRVLKAGEPAPHGEEEDAKGDVVSFLKEQQWKIPFRTLIAGRRKLVHSIHALGEVKHKPGLSVDVSAPVDGRVASAPPDVGQHVKAGDLLLEIAPFLAADVNRISGLVAKGLMPQKELEAARMQLTIAESKIASATQHRQTYLAAQHTETSMTAKSQHFEIKAPISGEISRVDVTRDELVTRDKRLLEIDDPSRVRVELKVFEPDLAEAREATGAVFNFLGEKKAFTLEELRGKLVHVSHHMESGSRTAPVIFEIDNPGERVPFGGFVEADILTKQSGSYLAVPLEAVMEDQGKSVVFVHTSGEEFEKREVVTGVADRGWVAITSGVKPGERVVTTGAYQIRLSTLSGAIPEHGHTH